MSEVLEIIELINRDPQGILKPWEGRGSDGNRYFIKQLWTHKHPLMCEWVAGRLAMLMDLPIPPFRVVNLSKDLVKSAPVNLKSSDLIAGPAFASLSIEQGDLFHLSLIPKVPQSLRERIVLFDLWILNADRRDSNPNLVWDNFKSIVSIIDHHQAFADPPLRVISKNHIFRHDLTPYDRSKRAFVTNGLKVAYDEIDKIYSEIPKEWMTGNTLPIDNVKRILGRAFEDESVFWNFEV